MTNREYGDLVKRKSPGSKSYINIPVAFLVGGTICTLGEGLIHLYQWLGVSEELSPTACSVTLVFLSALLTWLGVYDRIAKHAGAGTLVPITGFANAVAAPALEFKSEGLVMGVAAKMFIIAGPVIVYGIAASVVYGLIAYFFGLY